MVECGGCKGLQRDTTLRRPTLLLLLAKAAPRMQLPSKASRAGRDLEVFGQIKDFRIYPNAYTNIYIYIKYIYKYICINIYIYVCICMCVQHIMYTQDVCMHMTRIFYEFVFWKNAYTTKEILCVVYPPASAFLKGNWC